MEVDKPDELEMLINERDSLLAQHRDITQRIEELDLQIIERIQPNVD